MVALLPEVRMLCMQSYVFFFTSSLLSYDWLVPTSQGLGTGGVGEGWPIIG